MTNTLLQTYGLIRVVYNICLIRICPSFSDQTIKLNNEFEYWKNKHANQTHACAVTCSSNAFNNNKRH